MFRIHVRRAGLVAGSAVAAVLALAGPAFAHVTVNPTTAAQGSYIKVTFRVPNEKDSARTTKVEVHLPAATPVASVSVKPLPGWTARTEKSSLATPVRTDDGDVTEAVTDITWMANSDEEIEPGQFQEFDVSLGPLPDADQMVFKTLQTYSDGDVVRWIEEPSGASEPEHQAPVLKLTKMTTDTATSTGTPAAAGTPASGGGVVHASGDTSSNGPGIPLDAGALVLGLAGLVTGLLAYRRAGRASRDRAGTGTYGVPADNVGHP